jgi:hypothetical protein
MEKFRIRFISWRRGAGGADGAAAKRVLSQKRIDNALFSDWFRRSPARHSSESWNPAFVFARHSREGGNPAPFLSLVIPAEAGIQLFTLLVIPAKAVIQRLSSRSSFQRKLESSFFLCSSFPRRRESSAFAFVALDKSFHCPAASGYLFGRRQKGTKKRLLLFA